LGSDVGLHVVEWTDRRDRRVLLHRGEQRVDPQVLSGESGDELNYVYLLYCCPT